MGEPHATNPMNYFDDGPQEAQFIEWAHRRVKELGLTQVLEALNHAIG